MKIIIDVPESIYKEIQNKFLKASNNITVLDRLIFSGKPISKWRERIIDQVLEDIKVELKSMTVLGNARDVMFYKKGLNKAIEKINAHKADKEK